MARPEHLPDFGSPPLDEVVVGVQFAPPPNYSSVFTKDVWGLFRERYPIVQEHPPLEPSFETFGGPNPHTGLRLSFGTGPLRPRLWFMSQEQNHLIQFQEDRLLLNWRKRQKDQDYPHFEGIAESFEAYLRSLQQFFESSLEMPLDINQAEVSYINNIQVEKYSSAGEWLRFWDLDKNLDIENLNLNFAEIINDLDGKPYARLSHELQSVITTDGKYRGLRLSFTFRGKPTANGISEAMSFIRAGREKIVTRFSGLTTDNAHARWGRKK